MASFVSVDKDGSFIMPGEVRYDADDSQPTYVGIAGENKTPTDSPAWTIYKFTYSGSATTRIQKVSNKAWDDRATASFWS